MSRSTTSTICTVVTAPRSAPGSTRPRSAAIHEARPSNAATTSEHGRANIARFHFLDPTARNFFVDWDAACHATVALLRAQAGREPHDRALRELIGELSTLRAKFRKHWAAHDVRIRHDGIKRLRHPEAGDLDLPLTGSASIQPSDA
ncbi:hypothetical protein [Streptomyces sp. NPDC017993]|uniref:MmyB family transcriptional regulator n=1 Tax=Streptomyces sp. NPDC017993 TaxID=3365027 RepID=UPI0037B65D08